ncbi:RrF2 family transcriptional regulator [Sphaerisporangium flaviroseum]|uniref:RrF2 family transcriptional regulator n=1 Tax=Sphaerisporangium flaviroseum TaxID=509199 RepID=A0ABP7I7H1_9ACTN
MRLSARVDYALRAAAELAASGSGPTTVGELAKEQEMPPKYLENILLQMRRAGLVRGQRGPEGGYVLARPATEISLADVIRAVDGPLANVRGERPEHVGYRGAARSLQQVWIALRASERAILEEVTLDQIAADTLPDRVLELAADPAAWD